MGDLDFNSIDDLLSQSDLEEITELPCSEPCRYNKNGKCGRTISHHPVFIWGECQSFQAK